MKQGWEIKKLGEVIEVLDNLRKPITKRDRIEGEYPYYGATGILSYVHNYIFSEKLVLIGEDGAKWLSGDNTSFIADGKFWVNNHAHVIRPIRILVRDEWIVYFLNFSDLTPFITGMTVPKLNQEKMRSIPIPIPPLPEQERILAILDEAFAAIAKAKANAEQNLKNAKELFESYLQEVLENGNWEEKTLGQLSKNKDAVVSGPFGSNLKVSDYKSEGIPILRLQNIGKGYFINKSIKYITEKKAEELKYHSFVAGDIALAKLGIPIGKTCIIPENFKSGIITADIVRIRPDSNVVNYKFLENFLNTSLSVSQLTGNISGATRPRVNLSDVRNIIIKLPSLKEQENIVQKLNALSTETKKLEAIYQQKINDLEELKKSVLQKAFSGELKTNAVAV